MFGNMFGIDINGAMEKMAEFHVLFERLVNTIERVEQQQQLIIQHLGIETPVELPAIEHTDGVN